MGGRVGDREVLKYFLLMQQRRFQTKLDFKIDILKNFLFFRLNNKID
jgi:hypothetical protein